MTGLASRHFTAILVATAALAVTLAVLGRAGQDFSNDEPFTALMLEKSTAELRDVFVDDNIPLWYGLLRPWRANAKLDSRTLTAKVDADARRPGGEWGRGAERSTQVSVHLVGGG